MDVRRYLDIEKALPRRMRLEWAKQAASLYYQINAACDRGDFEGARRLCDQIDFEAIARKHRGWTKAMLWTTAVFGAKLVSRKPMLGVTSFESLLEQVTDNFVTAFKYHVTPGIRELALQSVAKREQVRKEDRPDADQVRYVREFVSFAKEGDRKIRLISSLHSSRLSTWGFVAEARLEGITEYQLRAVLDGRTSDFCRAIDGKRFLVADADRSINTVLRVEDPADVKHVQPWPKQDERSMQRYEQMTAAELTAEGLHIPPFHPNCRTVLMKTRYDKGTMPEFEVPQQNLSLLRVIDESDFFSLGLKVSPEDLALWNRKVGVSPLGLVATALGMGVDEVLGAKLPKFFRFKKDGTVALKFDTEAAFVGQVWDAAGAELYITQLDMEPSDYRKAATTIKNVYNGAVANTERLGGERVTTATDGKFGLYSHAQYGFVPASAVEWSNLRDELLIDLSMDGGRLAGLWAQMSSQEEATLKLLLNSPDPKAFWGLSELPHGRELLHGRALPVSLHVNDKDAMERFRGYF